MKKLLGLLILVCGCSSPSDPVVRPSGDAGDDPTDAANNVSADAGFDDGTSRDSDTTDDQGGVDGGGDSGPDAGGTVLSFAEYCDEIGRTYLDWLAQCYGSENYDPLDPGERERFASACHRGQDSADSGRIAFDGAQAAACIEALDTANCDRFRFFSDEPACANVTTSAQAEGDACYASAVRHFSLSEECSTGFCSQLSCPGTCTQYAALGESCVNAVCEPTSLYCDFDADRCAPFAGEGDDCALAACAPGLQCHLTNQTCFAPALFGETCDASNDLCEAGTFCSAGTCRSKVARGEECKFMHHCPDGDTCLDPDGEGGTPGTCAARSPTGGACLRGRDCQPGHYCRDDVCVAFPTAGQPCESGLCGVDLWCRHQVDGDIGTCEPDGAAGANCAYGDGAFNVFAGCEDGLLCIDGTCAAPGQTDDPCLTNTPQTCEDGFFCLRSSSTCQPNAAAGQACNPIWPQSCAPGLGCHCTQNDATCEAFEADVNPGDTCETSLGLGDTCWRSAECASRNCFDHDSDGTSTCQPGDCLP